MKQRKRDSRRDDNRNLDILKRVLSGEKHGEVAKLYGITPGRVGQIAQREQRYYPSLNFSESPKV